MQTSKTELKNKHRKQDNETREQKFTRTGKKREKHKKHKTVNRTFEKDRRKQHHDNRKEKTQKYKQNIS